jgi:hypothetical protein
MNLFQIEQQYLNLSNELLEVGGELTPELEQALEISQEQLNNKGIAYGFIIKKFETESDIIDAEIKRLQALKKSRENTVERLKERIKSAMELFDVDKIETPLMKLSFRKSEAIQIDDITLIPSMYKTLKVTEHPDKTLIKDSLKLGKEVKGASLVINNNLQIK